MKIILSVLLYPVFLITMLFSRIIITDIVGTVKKIWENIVLIPSTKGFSLLSVLWLVITFPVVIVIEIPVSVVVCSASAFSACVMTAKEKNALSQIVSYIKNR